MGMSQYIPGDTFSSKRFSKTLMLNFITALPYLRTHFMPISYPGTRNS